MTSSLRTWLSNPKSKPDARLRLFCFPFAGGGASLFRTWSDGLPQDVEVWPVQLPGREERFSEPRIRRVTEAAQAVAPFVVPLLDKPYAVVGHSMGALIGFELIRELRRRKAPMPHRFFVTARQAPQVVETRPALHGLPDREFFETLQQRYGGIPFEAMKNPDIREVFRPLLQADLEMVETYCCRPEDPLDCAVSVFGGKQDSISESDLKAWQDQFRQPAFVQMFDGSHFFMQTAQDALLAVIGRQLSDE